MVCISIALRIARRHLRWHHDAQALQAPVEDETDQDVALLPAETEIAELPRKPANMQATLSDPPPKLDHASRLPESSAHTFGIDDQQARPQVPLNRSMDAHMS